MPISISCSGCGRSFHLKDEMAGRKVRCPECEAVLVVPEPEDEDVVFELDTADHVGQLHPAFNRDRFLLRQKLMTISEKYVVWDDQQRPILFIERPAHFWWNILGAFVTVIVLLSTTAVSVLAGIFLSQNVQPAWLGLAVGAVLETLSVVLTVVLVITLSPKRHISFYSDESKGERLLQVLQDKKFQPITATYTVLTPEGDLLGRMKKNYLYNFFRKKWDVLDAQGRNVLIAREDSLLLSLLRRFLGPMMGFLRANFILVVPQGDRTEETRGEFNRNFTLFDRYVLDLSRDRPRTIDRRLAIALGVLLDTGENR
jgi:DNA-directed RNA polymerase subunit RPC12/RpoP